MPQYYPFRFHLDASSGVPTYLQLRRQVGQAVRLGWLTTGDRLPTAREVVEDLGINPNTVHKAYRELERDGLVEVRPGQGTFLVDVNAGPGLRDRPDLRAELEIWLERAAEAGFGETELRALVEDALASRRLQRSRAE